MDDQILIDRKDAVGIVTVNRPEQRNAMDTETFRRLREAFLALDAEPGIRVIVVTGAGENSFVSGADLHTLRGRSVPETFRAYNSKTFAEIEALGTPTIAAINGYAFGGGLELAMACDLRVCSRAAKLGQTELGLGFLPGAGGTQRLIRLVGLGRAKELVLTGRVITPEEALAMGLVNQLAEPGELMERTLALAGQIAQKSALVLGLAKLVMNEGCDIPMGTALTLERLGQTAAFGFGGQREGIDAFLEKRAPKFEE